MLKHSLQFKLSQKLSPQQIQLMKLIQLPTQAFEQRLQEELVENPALEENTKEDDYDLDDYEVNSNEDDYDDFDGDHIDTQDINIDEYLSNDETPDYKYQTNNYSDDDDDKSLPFAAPVSFHQDLITYKQMKKIDIPFIKDNFENWVAVYMKYIINRIKPKLKITKNEYIKFLDKIEKCLEFKNKKDIKDLILFKNK